MRRPFKKGQEIWLTVKRIQLISYFFMSAVFIGLYPVGKDLQKNGPRWKWFFCLFVCLFVCLSVFLIRDFKKTL